MLISGTGDPLITKAALALPLSRNRRFQALWVGGATAYLGSSFVIVAAPLLILSMTGSAAQAGVYGFVDATASIAAGLPAGMLLDRYDRRTLMIASETVRALAYATAVAALLAGHLTMLHVFAVAAVTGAARTFSGPARSLATRAVVAPEQLTKALATEEVRTHTASIIGPSLAGVLFAVSRTLPFVGAAIGYLVSAICAFAVPRDTEARLNRRDAATGGTLGGIKILMRDPMLRVCLIALSLVNLGGVAIELVVVVLIRQHGGSSSAVGGALALAALGGLVGAALVTPLHRLLRPGLLLIALMLWVAALNTALVIPFGAWWYGSILAVTMLGVPAAVVLLDVLIFRQVDDAVRGRTISSTMTILNVGLSLGPLAAGLLMQYAGATSAVLAFSAVIAAAGFGALGSRAVRSARWPETAPASTPAQVTAVAIEAVVADA
ncbi:MAG TPA: MFS transporter [Actinocrinis sp.]|nr:MFS transporter [Actinocrinis sp.]